MEGSRRFLFVFPKLPCDLNPSLPVARRLVSAGHSVHYLCPDYREAIEDTGATFLDATEYYELYTEGRTPETFGAAKQLRDELHLPEEDGEYLIRVKVSNIELEKKIEGVLRAIAETQADTILYDPVLNREAPKAAEIAKVRPVALLALNGHGAWAALVRAKMKNDLPDIESEEERIKVFERAAKSDLNAAATERLNAKYVPRGMRRLDGSFAGGKLEPIPRVCIVATTEAMKEPETPDLARGSRVVHVGALLDLPGALRAGGPTTKDHWKRAEAKMEEKKEGGKTVYVSMGTVTTSDGPLGWQGKPSSCLTGEQVCKAVWGAVFDAVGGERGSGNVILMNVGKDASGAPRPLASGDMVPGNALVCSSMPQIDILAKGVDLFVTHGGQNSFVEGISFQTPMLVAPTVGEQVAHARQVLQMGVGEVVYRPQPCTGDTTQVALDYRKEVKKTLLSMLEDLAPYKDAVEKASTAYLGGGVEQTAATILAA